MPADFVFTTFEFGGHVTPALATASRLAARGHRVLVVSDDATRAEAAGFDLPFLPWATAPNRPDKQVENEPLRDWEAETPAEVVSLLLDRLMVGAAGAYASDTAAVLDANPGAVLVSQELLLGCMLAAESRGAPLALHTANVWPLPTLSGVPPFGPGLEPPRTEQDIWFQGLIRDASGGLYDLGLTSLNATRSAFGLGPLDHTLEQIDVARLILLSAARAYDFAPEALPAPFVYAGPQARVPAWAAAWNSPWGDTDQRPLVLVSFSTLYQAQEPVIRRVVAALAALPVRAVVTLGPQLDLTAVQSPSPDVVVVESASHDALMPHLAAMVTHAGHGSAIRPILNGVPVLCLPMGRDQPDNAARIAARGAGLRLDPGASSDEIGAAVMRLIAEPTFKNSARTWGGAIRAEVEAAGDVAVDRLEALLAQSRREDGGRRGVRTPDPLGVNEML